jgi:hypothetical protein
VPLDASTIIAIPLQIDQSGRGVPTVPKDGYLKCQNQVQDLTTTNNRLRKQVQEEKDKAVRIERRLQELTSASKGRHWDRWLSLTSLAVSVIVWLIPNRNQGIVIGGCILVFACLFHPFWAFPWIEKRIWRRVSSMLALACGVIWIGYMGWPRPMEGIPPIVITQSERYPDTIKLGSVLSLHVHLRNTSSRDVHIKGNFRSYWANNPSTDFHVRNQKEEEMWESFASSPMAEGMLIRIPAFEKDHWIAAGGDLPPLTDETQYELHHTQVIYWLREIKDKQGRVITEFCAFSGYDDSTVRYCIDHNGPPVI